MKTLKRVLALSFIVAIGLTAFAFTDSKEGDVPQKVRDAFAKKFPTEKKGKWEKENATEWEAEFKMNRVEYSANFLKDGTWKETEHEIEETAIPQSIKTSLTNAFAGYEIEEAEISETQDGTFYEFEIEMDTKVIEVSIDSSGNLIKKYPNEVDNSHKNDND